MFTFKQFVVHDEACGMKVGTDGTLLGAWAPVSGVGAGPVLDVGTGSGLIALMLAQRCPEATVLGIDSDEAAATQAADNFARSPWPERLQARHIALQQMAEDRAYAHTFQLIVSNPPYFVDSLKNPDAARRAARHTDSLSFPELLSGSMRLLRHEGTLALILPAETETTILALAAEQGLTPYSITRVCTRAGKPAKRVLLALREGTSSISLSSPTSLTGTLILQDESGAPRSTAYQTLCKDFYL